MEVESSMGEKVKLDIQGKTYEFPVIEGTEKERVNSPSAIIILHSSPRARQSSFPAPRCSPYITCCQVK